MANNSGNGFAEAKDDSQGPATAVAEEKQYSLLGSILRQKKETFTAKNKTRYDKARENNQSYAESADEFSKWVRG